MTDRTRERPADGLGPQDDSGGQVWTAGPAAKLVRVGHEVSEMASGIPIEGVVPPDSSRQNAHFACIAVLGPFNANVDSQELPQDLNMGCGMSGERERPKGAAT